MSKYTDFEVGTIVTDTFLDSIQELLTGTINNFRLAEHPTSGAMLGAALTGDVINDKRATVNIGGKYVYTDQFKDSESNVPTSAGTYDVYLSTVSPATPSLDPPDFRLSIGTPGSGTGPAVQPGTYLRRIGSVSTTGTQVSNVKMNNGVMADADQYNAFTFRSVINTAAETVLTLRGQSGQTSLAGATTSAPSSSPTKALSVGFDTAGVYGEELYIDTSGRIVWENGVTDIALNRLAADTLGSNAQISVWREGLNTTVAFPDPTRLLTTDPDTITRNDGVAAFGAQIEADVNDRVQISQTGIVQFGDGTSLPDTGFYRPKADALAMLPGDKFYLDYTINNATDGDFVATNKLYVDTQVTSAISESKRFAFFITP